jgi:glycosyltransferase involved in cell wall biosynthesis
VRFHEWLRDLRSELAAALGGRSSAGVILPTATIGLGDELVKVAEYAMKLKQLKTAISYAQYSLEQFELRPAARIRAIILIYRAGVSAGSLEATEYALNCLNGQLDALLAKIGVNEFLSGIRSSSANIYPIQIYLKVRAQQNRRENSMGLHNFQLNNSLTLEGMGVGVDPLFHINSMRGDNVVSKLRIKRDSPVLIDNLEIYPNDSSGQKRSSMNSEPVVSVIMPVFNASSTIRYSVQSILDQTLKNFELLIVDDGSSDDSVRIAKQLEAQDGRIKIFEREGNYGAYPARNFGIFMAKGEFVTVQDADDWSLPERLEIQLKAISGNSTLVASYSTAVRVTRDLRVLNPESQIMPTSLLFKRSKVLDEAGYLDRELVGCDSEFLERLWTIFGPSRVVLAGDHPLNLCLQSEGSLSSSSELGLVQGQAPGGFRYLYRDAWRELHSDKDRASNTFPLKIDDSLGLMNNYGTTKSPLGGNQLGALIDFTSTNIDTDQIKSLIPDQGVLELAHNMCVFGDGKRISKEVKTLTSLPNVRLSTKTRVEKLSSVERFPCSGSERGFGDAVIDLCPCSSK